MQGESRGDAALTLPYHRQSCRVTARSRARAFGNDAGHSRFGTGHGSWGVAPALREVDVPLIRDY